MHVLVIFAHPSRGSFTGQVAEAFCQGLHTAGHTVEFADLYQEGFNPTMEAAQFDLETSMDPQSPRPGDVQAEQARLDRAEGLVFVYPFWWSDVPAILKGWFDRVWTYGYAYAYEADRSRTSQLRVQKALALCLAGHTDEKLEALGLRDAHYRILVEDRLLGVGIPEAHLEIMGGLSGNLPERRTELLLRARSLGQAF
ncbi:MAG: putative oxidoreductase [Holophagaceae bacterium]|nr:putative oxidoreductase [Holophagaceae bacterium]